jgi:hypothetical protein
MADQNQRTEEIRRQAYASAHELLGECGAPPFGLAYDRLLNLLVIAWLDGYGKMADWTKGELDATTARLTAAVTELGE